MFLVLIALTGMPISAQVSLSNPTGLTFGSLVAGSVSGTVTVPHDGGSRHCTADIICIPQNPGSAARFEIAGDALRSYTITLPGKATLSHDGAGNSMMIDDFFDSEGGSGVLDVTGHDTFTVGATLYVGVSQESGAYGGTFEIIVEYE